MAISKNPRSDDEAARLFVNTRHKRRSPKWPGPTCRGFAVEVDSTETIIRGLVASGWLPSVEVNGITILTPQAREKWDRTFGPIKTAGKTQPAPSINHEEGPGSSTTT
jgi:hypothetical protein